MKLYIRRWISLPVIIFLVIDVNPIFALVDYGVRPSQNEKRGLIGDNKDKNTLLKEKIKIASTSNLRSGTGLNGETKFVEFGTSYDFFKMDSPLALQVERLNLMTTLRVRQDLSLDFSYWQGKIEGRDFTGENSDKKKWSEGNPKIIVNVNWLRFGKDDESTNVDFFGGVIVGIKNSPLATSRTDKLVGLETSKRFSRIILAIRGEYRPTGKASDHSELEIGNMQSFSVGLGWMVSNDIRLSVESETHQIKKGDINTIESNKLNKDFIFSTLSPRIYLGLSSLVELQLGFVIRTRSGGNEQEALKAKLFEFPGAYGNTFILGLNFSV